MERYPLSVAASAAWFAICLNCLVSDTVGHEVVRLDVPLAFVRDASTDVPPGAHPDQNIAQMIKDLELCFLQPGGPMTPLKVQVPLLGEVDIWKLCCQNTVVAGLNLTMHTINPDAMWAGDTTFNFQLGHLATHCNAQWSFGTWKGGMTMNLGTAARFASVASKPFIDLAVSLDGEPIASSSKQYPWPGKVRNVGCAVHFELSNVVCSSPDVPGWVMAILNSGARTVEFFQGAIGSLVCPMVKSQVPATLNKVLTQVRTMATPYIQNIPDDLDPPKAPDGAGATYDLRDVKPLSFMHSLAQQGLETGGLSELVRHVGHGKDSAEFQMGAHGLQIVQADLTVPANLSLEVWLKSAGLEGVGTIDQLDIASQDKAVVGINLGQRHLNVSTKIRTLTMETQLKGSDGLMVARSPSNSLTKLLASVAEYLVENFELRLHLSDLHLKTLVGVLVDKNQTDYLVDGSSWYLGSCLPTVIQNASVMHMDLQVVVDQFRFESVVSSPDQLEEEFDNCVNSILGYVNAPQMRPTVSRLVQSMAAGSARDLGNSVIQTMLAQDHGKCTSEVGFGWWTGFYGITVLGAACVLAAFGSLLAWMWCADAKRLGRCFAALLAAGGMLLLPGAVLGHPFGAVFRTHDGAASGGYAGQDTLFNMYVLEASDLVKYMPGTVAIMAISTMLWGARMMAVIGLAVWNPPTSRLSKFVRVSAALGGWGLAMLYMLTVTQVVSFYARVIQFGNAWMDMGIALRPSFYLIPLAFVLCDLASVVVYRTCQASRLEVVKYEEPPSRAVLVCLAVSLMVLVVSPFFTLWTHNYSGLMGNVIHYQYGGLSRQVSVWSVLANAQEWLANPGEIGVGVYIVMAIIVVNIVVAPVVNAALSLYVAVRLRMHGRGHFQLEMSFTPWLPECSTYGIDPSFTRGNTVTSSFTRETAEAGPLPNVTSDTRLPTSFDTFGEHLPTMESGATFQTLPNQATFAGTAHVQHGKVNRLAWALVVARMWSGADAFAVCMAIIVPELGNQLRFMSMQACVPMKPMLDKLNTECNKLSSELNFGLLFLFLAAFAARILSELAAHGPLRGTLRKADQRELQLVTSAC